MRRPHAVVAALLASGCSAQMDAPFDDSLALVPSEGVIAGSVMLAHASGDSQLWLGIPGRAADVDYVLGIEEVSGLITGVTTPNTFAKKYAIQANLGVERVFVARLPAGDYFFRSIVPEGMGSEKASYVGVFFTVTPGVATYIGRLNVEIRSTAIWAPNFMMMVTTSVEDAQDRDVGVGRGSYPRTLAEVSKDLMSRR